MVGIVILMVIARIDITFAGILLIFWVPSLFQKLLGEEQIKPRFAGHHKGLNILNGLSDEFLREVQRMIDRHNTMLSDRGQFE